MADFDSFEDFGDLEFADNADSRAACVLVLDVSSSMAEPRPGETLTPLEALNNGLDTLVTELHKDPLAKRRVEVSVVTFGTHVSPATDFATVDNLVLPTLVPSGTTSTGKAIETALDAIDARKKTYKENGVEYYRPWVLLISDGLATDDVAEAARRVKEAEANKAVAFFAVGVDGADLDSLAKLTTRQPLMLKGLAFDELFQWLSASQAAVSSSQVGDTVAIPAPTGWAEV